MQPPQENNPFTLVYDALWRLVESNPKLNAWISQREKWDEPEGMMRHQTDSDNPELILVPTISSSNLRITSSATEITVFYHWLLSTGDQRLNRVLNQINWELFRSHTKWNKFLCSLRWPSYDPQNFVIQANLTDGSNSPPGVFDIEGRDEIRNWSSIWTFQVQMRFPTAYLEETIN